MTAGGPVKCYFDAHHEPYDPGNVEACDVYITLPAMQTDGKNFFVHFSGFTGAVTWEYEWVGAQCTGRRGNDRGRAPGRRPWSCEDPSSVPKGWSINRVGDISYRDPVSGEYRKFGLTGYDPKTGKPAHRSPKRRLNAFDHS